jgi:hypothetical protein
MSATLVLAGVALAGYGCWWSYHRGFELGVKVAREDEQRRREHARRHKHQVRLAKLFGPEIPRPSKSRMN